MIKTHYALTFLLTLLTTTSLSASCVPSVDIQPGWRRDNLDWKVESVRSCGVNAKSRSHIHYNDMESYNLTGTVRVIDCHYYAKLSADWGLSFKGRGKEHFKIRSSLFDSDSISVYTNYPMKRDNETYDFNGAFGYPFSFCCNRLAFIPTIGFSYHRQRIRIKQPGFESSHSDYFSSSSDADFSSEYYSFWEQNSYFFPDSSYDSSNPFDTSVSYNPFAECSSEDETIAHALGLRNYRRTQNYRFTWYGFYAGFDVAYALDNRWTLFGEFEGHFLNRCHRKRKSWTGVYAIDHYHSEGWSYGYNGVVGTTCSLPNDWYLILTVDYRWRYAHNHRHDDTIYWQSVSTKGGLGYMF